MAARAFGHTWDEPSHLAAGMQLLQYGEYTMEPAHPPLARIAGAIGPYLAGARIGPTTSSWHEGASLLEGVQYWNVLVLARAPMLLFLFLAVIGVYLWGRAVLGEASGLIGAAVFSMIPLPLAHGALVATDLASTAFLILACWCASEYARHRTVRWAVSMGAMAGLAIASKFTAVVFAPVLCGIILARSDAAHSFLKRGTPDLGRRHASLCILACIGMVIACYGYSVGSVIAPEALRGPRGLDATIAKILAMPIIPAPEAIIGIIDFADLGAAGRKSYLLGSVSSDGWPLYFPTVLAFKTPLVALALFVTGVYVAVSTQDSPLVTLLLMPLAILVLLAFSPTTIGLRHAMFVLAPLSLAGGAAAMAALRSGTPGQVAVALLISHLSFASLRAHPDYLPYFNELAGVPEAIAIDSDLDWGQDLHRLRHFVDSAGIDSIGLAYHGSLPYVPPGPDRAYELLPEPRRPGWVAISTYVLHVGRVRSPDPHEFGWLRNCPEVARVGASIHVFFLIADGAHGARCAEWRSDWSSPHD